MVRRYETRAVIEKPYSASGVQLCKTRVETSLNFARNNNCARGPIPWIYIWQWLKREKILTISQLHDSVVRVQAKLMAKLHLEFLSSTHMAGGETHDLLHMYWLLVKLLRQSASDQDCQESGCLV